MEVGKQFLPYKNPWSNTWHRTLGDSTPVLPEDEASLDPMPNGYLTHHKYTRELVNIGGQGRSMGEDVARLENDEKHHERLMSALPSPEAHSELLRLHGGNEASLGRALHTHRFLTENENHEQEQRERMSELNAEYHAGITTPKEYLQGVAITHDLPLDYHSNNSGSKRPEGKS